MNIESNKKEITYSSKIPFEEKEAIFWIYILFCIQGIVSGIFFYCLPLILTEKGADYSDIGFFYISFLPFSLKVFTAPIIDIKYSNFIGRRKSYILPCQYLLGLIFILISFRFQQYINNLDLLILGGISFLCFFLIAQQEIATDALGLSLLSEDNRKFGPTCSGLGQITGILATNYFLILQNVPIQTYLLATGMIIILITTIMIFYLKEKDVGQQAVDKIINMSVVNAYKLYARFLKNRLLLILIIFVLFHKVLITTVSAAFQIQVMQHGIKKEYLAYIDMIQIPVYFILPIITQMSVKKYKEMDFQQDLYLVRFGVNILGFFIITLFSSFNDFNGKFLTAAFLVLDRACFIIMACGIGIFFSRISDNSIGGMYYTLLSNAATLGNTLSQSLNLLLIDYFGYNLMVFVTWMIALFSWIKFKNQLINLQTHPSDDWKIIKQIDNDQSIKRN